MRPSSLDLPLSDDAREPLDRLPLEKSGNGVFGLAMRGSDNVCRNFKALLGLHLPNNGPGTVVDEVAGSSPIRNFSGYQTGLNSSKRSELPNVFWGLPKEIIEITMNLNP
jgi:hypothetical protein